MKIINTSDKPYNWQYDGGNYGPLAPGEIMDVPEDNARHAVKRSAVLDDEGNLIGHRAALYDRREHAAQVVFKCPMAEMDQCNAEPFKSMEALRSHLDTAHFGPKPKAGKAAQLESA